MYAFLLSFCYLILIFVIFIDFYLFLFIFFYCMQLFNIFSRDWARDRVTRLIWFVDLQLTWERIVQFLTDFTNFVNCRREARSLQQSNWTSKPPRFASIGVEACIMRKRARPLDFVTSMTLFLGFWNCLNITNEFCTSISTFITETASRKLFTRRIASWPFPSINMANIFQALETYGTSEPEK